MSPVEKSPNRPLEYEALQTFRMFLAADHREQMRAIDRQLEERNAQPNAIVVVGEVSTGKSSLVNALLERPGLSPSGAAETTGTYLIFAPPSERLPEGRAVIELADGGWRPIETDELPGWVLVGSAPLRRSDDVIPLGAVVAAESPTLPGIQIVDTPGVGGLDPAHARLALARAARASILVLVTGASGRLTTPELDFLRECSEHVEAVVIVMNQIDLVRDWHVVAQENRDLLREDPRFERYDVVGVSAMDALRSLGKEGAARERLRKRSGIDELISALQAHAAIADRLPTVHALRRCLGVVRQMNLDLTAKLDATLAGDTGREYAESLRDRQRRLEAQRKTWRSYLDRDFRRLRLAITEVVEERATAFTSEWDRRLSSKRLGLSSASQMEFTQELVAQYSLVGQDLAQLIAERVTELVSETFTRRGLRDLSADLLQDSEHLRSLRMGMQEHRSTGAPLDVTLAMSGYMGANVGVALVNGIAGTAAASVFGPVGLVFGAGMILANLMGRNAQQRLAEIKGRVRELGVQLQRELMRVYDSYATEYAPDVALAFEAELDRTLRELRENAKIAEASATASEEERTDAVAEIQHRSKELARVIDIGIGAIDRLRGAELSARGAHPIS